MENEIKNEVETNEKDYLAEIENLKANTVSKEAYEKMRAENAKLIKTIATNQKIEQESKKPEMTREQKLARHEEIVKHLTNADGRKGRELIAESIEFRNLTKELYGIDPMLVKVNNGTEEDIEKLTKSMDKVESKFQECVDNSSNEKEFLRNVEDAIDSSGYNRIRATYSKIN